MRPAQKAPENLGIVEKTINFNSCFNEAGAKSAGKRFPLIIKALKHFMLQ